MYTYAIFINYCLNILIYEVHKSKSRYTVYTNKRKKTSKPKDNSSSSFLYSALDELFLPCKGAAKRLEFISENNNSNLEFYSGK